MQPHSDLSPLYYEIVGAFADSRLDGLDTDALDRLHAMRDTLLLGLIFHGDESIDLAEMVRRINARRATARPSLPRRPYYPAPRRAVVPSPVVSGRVRIGRNDPCPCGAADTMGRRKKFKKCCGRAGA